MKGLTKIVENEVEAHVTQFVNTLIHALKFGSVTSATPESIAFLSARQPVLPSGPQLTTNVRVMASEEPFPTIAAMVEDLERNRDSSEATIRTRMLELELKLLQAENSLVQERI